MKSMILALALSMPQIAFAQAPAGSLELCLSRYRAGQARYIATVRWNQTPSFSHLLLGALDQSNVVWVQRTYETPTGRGVNYLRFTVSDVSSYPLAFSMYDLTDAAYREYSEACQTHQECYFGPNDPGVTQLSSTSVAVSAAEVQSERPCAAPREE